MMKPPLDYCVLFIRQDEHSNHSQRFLFIQLTLFLNYRNARFCLENYHLKVKSHWSALALSGAFSFESESHCAALALIQGICI